TLRSSATRAAYRDQRHSARRETACNSLWFCILGPMTRSGSCVIVLLVACHANPMNGDDAPIDGALTVDADPGWAPLVMRSWTLPSNSEAYRCTRIQIPTDMWVSGFRAISPPGTHHG